MARKPANLQYTVEDVPPWPVIVLNALQYAAILAGYLVYPLIMAREAHASPEVIDSVLSWSMIVIAVGTTLQALPKGPVGSGYLVPSTMTSTFLPPSLEAVRLGGLPLLAGMTVFGGVVEAALSRSMHRLRALLPPELAGVVILLVALTNGILGFRYLLVIPDGATPGTRHWIVAAITLSITVVLSVWSKGILRASCALTGMFAGYLVALSMGLIPQHELVQLSELPLLQLPRVDYFGWAFETVLVVPFVIAALANTLKAAALLTTVERMTDADWVRPDMRRMSGGVLADGVATVVSGGVCVFGVNLSAPAVGLSEATGIASRVVAYAIGAMFVLMAFVPDLIRVFTLTPAAVIGATFVFTSCVIMKNGIETIASRMLDARRTLVVGLAILTGLAVEAFPGFFRAVPAMFVPLVGSPLVLGTMVGFALNAVFRLGTRRQAVLTIDPRAIDLAAVHTFLDGRGEAWGARRDVIARASYAAQQLIEVITDTCDPHGPIALSGSFNEFDLIVEARYAGGLLELPERRPSADEITDSEDGVRRLAGFLLRHNADRSTATRRGEVCIVRLQFHH